MPTPAPDTEVSTENDATTLVPETTVDDDNQVSAKVTQQTADALLEQVQQNDSKSAVIAPATSDSTSATVVEVPSSFVSELASETDADLTIKTQAGDIVLANDNLADVAALTRSTLTISAENQRNGTVTVELQADGTTLDQVPGGLTVEIPTTGSGAGNVVVLSLEDGTQQVVKKAVVLDGMMIARLNGSATITIIDNSKAFTDVGSHWPRKPSTLCRHANCSTARLRSHSALTRL